MPPETLLQSTLPGIPVRRGKVRDVYDFGERLLIVATDRISAFDWVLPNGIHDKGRVLTQLSAHWFRVLDVPHHLLSLDPNELPLPAGANRDELVGRSMVVRKTQVFPIECVARGYLAGSGWKEYRERGAVCGVALPPGLTESDRLPQPIFTPATKAESGHDVNITFDQMAATVGQSAASELRRRTLEAYDRAAQYALDRGIIIADTKFEFGSCDAEILMIDEVLTPDSSRFWPADRYEPGRAQPSFDKQFVRDWLETTPWDKNSPPPALPDEVVEKTRAKYIEAFERLTGTRFAPP
ncbi:MAG: phosphoribosylaminoimidazolesuccinocarboxamide synthase [Planctomycetaceae bacterium]